MSGDKLYTQCMSCGLICDPEDGSWIDPICFSEQRYYITHDVCKGPLCALEYCISSFKTDERIDAALEKIEMRKKKAQSGNGD